MSTNAIIYTLAPLINSSGFTEKEKNALQKYFIGDEKRQDDALIFLQYLTTNEAKLDYLRTLISTPGMFSHRDLNNMFLCLLVIFINKLVNASKRDMACSCSAMLHIY